MTEPSVAQEVEDRAAQMAKLAALFQTHPLEDIEPDVLRAVTPHYQQRISECRRKLKMRIVNVPQSVVVGMKRVRGQIVNIVKKRDGAYRYEPHERLGRDAGEQVPATWNQDRPFAEPFRLT